MIRWQANVEALVRFDRSIESFVVFAGWLFERSSSGSGNSHLVLTTTVVWFLRRPSGSGDGRPVLATVVRFGDGRLVLTTVVRFYDGRPVLRRSSGSDHSPLLATVLVPP